MGQISGTIETRVNLQDFVTAGYVTGQTFAAQLLAPGIPGALLQYTYGTGALQADGIYFKPLTLAAATTTLDLTALTGIGGEAITCNRVREVIGFNPDGTAGHDVKIYQAAATPWAIAPPSANPWWLRAANGFFRLSDPNSTGANNGNVVSGTSKSITLDPAANTVTIYLLILTGSVQ